MKKKQGIRARFKHLIDLLLNYDRIMKVGKSNEAAIHRYLASGVDVKLNESGVIVRAGNKLKFQPKGTSELCEKYRELKDLKRKMRRFFYNPWVISSIFFILGCLI